MVVTFIVKHRHNYPDVDYLAKNSKFHLCALKYVSYDYCRYICLVMQKELNSSGDVHILRGTPTLVTHKTFGVKERLCATSFHNSSQT
jgi:hypothetical protein